MQIPLLVIVGPTGSGKTEVAVRVAKALDGEIVTADSMQIYRRMDIGTAKPSAEEQQGIPHHLIDVAAPDEAYSVARYVADADGVIAGIVQRGRLPIIAGGTGFYINALIDRWEFPPQAADFSFREALRAEAPETLHARLRAVDPLSADRLHPNDVKRVIRALEVQHLTGRALSTYLYKQEDASRKDRFDKLTASATTFTIPAAADKKLPYRPLLYGLTLPREELYARLEARVHAQLRAGLLEEVTRLYQLGYSPELPSMKGITYRQLLGFLRGDYDMATAIALMVRDNRRYAKRQFTWFQADPRIHWLDILAAGGAAGAAEQIIAGWREDKGEE